MIQGKAIEGASQLMLRCISRLHGALPSYILRGTDLLKTNLKVMIPIPRRNEVMISNGVQDDEMSKTICFVDVVALSYAETYILRVRVRSSATEQCH